MNKFGRKLDKTLGINEDKYADLQPKDGETILHCGHMGSNKMHFFKVQGVGITAEDTGEVREVSWILQCEMCLQSMPRMPTSPPDFRIGGYATWGGDEPVIKKPKQYFVEDTFRVQLIQ